MTDVETHDPRWRPPHCPNPNCTSRKDLSESWRYKKHGFFLRHAQPTRIRRFLCLHCRVSFSSQTFSSDYYLKRPDLLPLLMKKTAGGMANRQIARDVRCAPSTVDGQIARLGRHCLLFHQQLITEASPSQVVVLDGLHSFELSQNFPFEHLMAVDDATSLILGFATSPLRRSGRMTGGQKRRRDQMEARHGRPDPRAGRKAARELLETVTARGQQVILRTDAHADYRWALRRLPPELRGRITHQVTSSKQRRDRGNPLWEINVADRSLRHASKNHERETLSWSKRRQSSALRLAIYAVYRNAYLWRHEKRPGRTPAMLHGSLARRLEPEDILVRRLFVTDTPLSPHLADVYWGRIETAALPVNRRHELKRAW